MKRFMFGLGLIVILTATSWAGDGVWTTTGPDGGWAEDIAFDPSTPGVAYAGTPNWVFKTADGGDTWSPLRGSGTDPFPVNRAMAVAVSPEGTVYVGSYKNGFFRSDDGGESWIPGNTGIEGKPILRPIVVDPDPPYPIFLVAGARVYKSDDGGQSWQQVHGTAPTSLPTTVVDLVFHGGSLYAATRSGAFKTSDGGATWYEANGAWPGHLADTFLRAIAASGGDALFVATRSQGVHRSDDGGDTWYAANGTPPNQLPYGTLGTLWARTLAVDGNGNVYLGGSDGMFRGENGGQAWSRAALPYEQIRIYAVAADPTVAERLFAATYPNGALGSLDSGESWSETNAGLRAVHVQRIPNDPATPATSFTVSVASKTPDAGDSWEQYAQGLPSATFYDLAIWPGQSVDSPSRHFVVADSWVEGIYRRDDGDSSWTPLTPPTAFEDGARLTSVEVDPTDRERLFVGQFGFPAWVSYGDLPGGLFRSTDGGGSWTVVFEPPSPQFPEPGAIDAYEPLDIAIDPRDPQRIYVTSIWFLTDFVTWGWHVLRSTDGGGTWHEVVSGEGPESEFRFLVLDANDPAEVGDASTVYVYDQGAESTFRSRDGGSTWSPIGGASVAVDPETGGVLYGGFLDNIVRMSDDRGETWTPLPMVGFDNVIRGIGIAATSPPVIHVGTWGGVYSYALVSDEDGDGVGDDEDFCPGTVIPEAVPYFGLGVNHWALVDDDFVFDTTPSAGGGPELSFTTADTAGCSCEQIIEARGLGVGPRRLGCPVGVMQSWNPAVGERSRAPVVVIQPEEDPSIEPRPRRLRGVRRR